jgi:hypothetical protein
MAKLAAVAIALTLSAAVLAGCGGGSSDSSQKLASSRCQKANTSVLSSIAEGLTGGASIVPGSGVAVLTKTSEQSSTAWPKAIIAVKLSGGGSSGVAVWAVNSATDASSISPISAINKTAKEWSNWGAAAQPGSQAAKNAEMIAGFEASKDAEKCAK